MAYLLVLAKEFSENLNALDKRMHVAVWKKIKQVQKKPEHFEFLHKAKRIQKARIGTWRVLFRVEQESVVFYRIGKRKTVYGNILSQLLSQLS